MGNLGSIIGAIIGASFGFFFLGPFGLGLVGGLVGSFIGGNIGMIITRGSVRAYRRPGGSYNNSHQSKAFFESLFSMIGAVSIADGTIDEEEKETIRIFMKNQLRLNVEAQVIAMDIFNQAVSNRVPIEYSAKNFYKLYRYDRQLLAMTVDILLRVAYANNVYHPKEEEAVRKVVQIFFMPVDIYEQIKRRYDGSAYNSNNTFGGNSSGYAGNQSSKRSPAGSATISAYGVLNCSETASDNEVKKAYRKMVQEYHPDKVASKGLPEEFAEFAGEKFKEVQSAYETIKRARGMS